MKILKGRENHLLTDEPFNADRLLLLAERHCVNYQLFVFAQAHPGILKSSQVEILAVRCRKNAFRSLNQLHELIRIAGELRKSGIPAVVVKGPQLARMIYGREALKESLDLDILLVQGTDLQKAHTLLTVAGYTQSNLNEHKGKLSRKFFLIAKREVHYFNPRTRSHIDLHVRAGANTYLTEKLFSHIFDELDTFDMDGQPVTIFSREQYLVYLCYHGALHQFSRLGWLMDIRAFLKTFRDVLDYEKTIMLSRNIKSETGLFLTFSLLEKYFGDEVPALIKESMPGNKRFSFLVTSCTKMVSQEPGAGLNLKGRASRIFYLMRLISNWPGRIDLLYGVFMRFLSA